MIKYLKIAAAMGVTVLVTVSLAVVYFKADIPVLKRKSSDSLQIGIVNVSVIKERAKVYIEFDEMIERLQNKEIKEFLAKDTDFRSEFSELKKLWPDSTGTAPEKYVKRKQDLDRRVEETQQLMLQRKEALRNEFTQNAQKIENTIIQIIHDISEERNLKLVLNATMEHAKTNLVLYGGRDLDITEEVLHRLDEMLPTLGIEKK